MQTWQISQLTSVTTLTNIRNVVHSLLTTDTSLKSCRMSQNCDKLEVQVKTNCIAILTGRCIKTGSNDVMKSRSVMYKNPRTPLSSVGDPPSNFMQIEESRTIFARHQTFWEPHSPAIAAKLPYSGLSPPPMFSLLFVCLTVSNFAQELPNRFA